jgi:uncharacterized protein YbaA (DUF1428 family)
MARYVDGFVIPIPRKNLAAYRKMAQTACKVWMELGALEYRECVGEDLIHKKIMTFPRQIKAKRGEVILFSWIVYKSRAHRDQVNKKVMKDPRLLAMMDPENHPFDLKRMVYGGFEVIVEDVR